MNNHKVGLHDAVEDYCRNSLGELSIINYLHEEIDYPKKRTKIYDEFIEYNNKR